MSTTPADVPARVALWREQLRARGGARSREVAALSLLGLLSGLCETLVVVAVVALATRRPDLLPAIDVAEASTVLLAACALGAVAILAAAHALSARLTARVAATTLGEVQARLVGTYLRAPREAQARVPAGELQDLVSTRAFDVAMGAQQAAAAVSILLNLAVVALAALLLSAWATLLLAAALAIVVAVGFRRRAETRREAEAIVETSSRLATEVAETEMAARELRTFGVVDAAQGRVQEHVEAAATLTERWLRRTLSSPPLTRDASIALLVVALAVVVGTLDVGIAALGATTILLLRGLGHAQGLAGAMHNMVERRASRDRVEARLAEWAPHGPRGRRPCTGVTRLTLRGVSYTYPRADVAALDGIDLDLRRGEMLGVIGRTGAGKSTLAGVLLGEVPPSAGDVLVDGVPLAEIDPAHWYRRTAWVPQDARLLTGTIADNVRFLRDWIADDAVAAAIEAAGLGPEVARWELGSGHSAGPAGGSLSGGERQRVALARALAGAPDLLVLDEPTSALDAHTEAAVREALEAVRQSAAVVVIAHRLSTIRSCDRVAVLDEGRLVAIAPPAELEAANPWFQRAQSLARQRDALP